MADLFHCKIITTELHFRNHIKNITTKTR